MLSAVVFSFLEWHKYDFTFSSRARKSEHGIFHFKTGLHKTTTKVRMIELLKSYFYAELCPGVKWFLPCDYELSQDNLSCL